MILKARADMNLDRIHLFLKGMSLHEVEKHPYILKRDELV